MHTTRAHEQPTWLLATALLTLCVVACEPTVVAGARDGAVDLAGSDGGLSWVDGAPRTDGTPGGDGATGADGALGDAPSTGDAAQLDDAGAPADTVATPDQGSLPRRTFLTKLDSKMRKKPNGSAGVVMLVRRGQRIKDVDPRQPEQNQFVKLTFMGKQGWIKRDRLKYIPPGSSRMDVALLYPNGFFKRQAYHAVWNPTGPSASGNCAVASLAMAAMVFGKEPKNIDVEASIDRVRKLMGKTSDGGSSSLAQLRTGVTKLGMQYVAMSVGGLDTQLGKGRMVVLTGEPGYPGSSASTPYQKAFIAAGYSYTYTGHHSILVYAKLAGGKYLVGDPLSRVGTVKLTKFQMQDFWARWGGLGTAVWVK